MATNHNLKLNKNYITNNTTLPHNLNLVKRMIILLTKFKLCGSVVAQWITEACSIFIMWSLCGEIHYYRQWEHQ